MAEDNTRGIAAMLAANSTLETTSRLAAFRNAHFHQLSHSRRIERLKWISFQNFLLKIEDVGLSTCWVGHFVESQIKRELKVPKEVNVEAVFPIGFEYEKKRARKAKIDLDRILYFNKYGQKEMKEPKKLDV